MSFYEPKSLFWYSQTTYCSAPLNPNFGFKHPVRSNIFAKISFLFCPLEIQICRSCLVTCQAGYSTMLAFELGDAKTCKSGSFFWQFQHIIAHSDGLASSSSKALISNYNKLLNPGTISRLYIYQKVIHTLPANQNPVFTQAMV